MENLKTHMAVPLEQWQFQHPLRDPPMQKSFRWSEIYSSAPTKALSWRTWSCSHGVSVYAIAMTDDVIYSLRDRIQVCSKTYQSVITFLHLSWQSMIYIYIYIIVPFVSWEFFLDPFHWRIHGTVSWQPVLIKHWQSARGDGLPRAILGAANHVSWDKAKNFWNFPLYSVFSRDYHKGTLSKVSLSISYWFILPIFQKSEEIRHPKKQH